MSHARSQHPNAVLTPAGRLKMVRLVVQDGWTIEAVAERFQVDAKTVRKWRDRYGAEGEAGLYDRSSRPRRCPNRTPRPVCRRVLRLRAKRRWGADRIAHELGVAASTVQRILTEAGVGRLDRGDRATDSGSAPLRAVRRYQRDRPGELIHVDVKKIAAIPPGGGWRAHGRGRAPNSGAGYRYIHTALDDRTRLVYSEILHDEQGATAARFWLRAQRWFTNRGITCERVLTDNGACYRSALWRLVCALTATRHRRTRPYRPQTNGKVERYHRILLQEWAYIRPWTTEAQRQAAYRGFVHFYNQHRPHGALNWSTPSSTHARLTGDNLPGEHN